MILYRDGQSDWKESMRLPVHSRRTTSDITQHLHARTKVRRSQPRQKDGVCQTSVPHCLRPPHIRNLSFLQIMYTFSVSTLLGSMTWSPLSSPPGKLPLGRRTCSRMNGHLEVFRTAPGYARKVLSSSMRC